MQFELLTTYRDGAVITVTMNRPKQLNALSLTLEDGCASGFVSFPPMTVCAPSC